MKQITCQYAIVRFAPFIDTDEFANVGIVAISPANRFFGFELITRKTSRITDFFKGLEQKALKASLTSLKDELERINSLLKLKGFDKRLVHNDVNIANHLFEELIKPRENLIQFGARRAILTDTPESVVHELFNCYVEKDVVTHLATRKYNEAIMTQSVTTLLNKEKVAGLFMKRTYDGAGEKISLPFVSVCRNNQIIKAIKPLDLNLKDASSIISKGAKWEYRIRSLQSSEKLNGPMMFAVNQPTNENHKEAYDEAIDRLSANNNIVVPFDDKNQIVAYATQ